MRLRLGLGTMTTSKVSGTQTKERNNSNNEEK